MMTNSEDIIRVAKNKKVFRAADLKMNPGTARKELLRLTRHGTLDRVGHGLYSLANAELTEQQNILEVAAKIPSAVLCLLSALRFHDLTTQNPFEVWLAISRENRHPRTATVHTRVFRFARRVYEAGIETHLIDGVEVKVYSAAKTIADCFYFQKKIGLDVCLEALRDAWRQRKVTMDELYHFAEVRNVKGTMLPYLNTLS